MKALTMKGESLFAGSYQYVIIGLRGDFMSNKKQENAIIEGNLDPKHWVEKSDPLILMRTVPFSLGELKILDTYISRINAGDDTRRTVIFTKEEYEQLMGLNSVDYRTLKQNTKSLLGKVVELEMPDKEYLQFVLFEQARYHKDEYGKPVIELTCTSLAKDLFFCIEKYHYFKYALENVISLTRKASYLLYLHILTNRYRGEWEIKLEELRDKVLDCKGQTSYQEYKIFKNRVLDPAVKEVNQKTDCHFEYQAIKRGRKVAKIKFIYHSIGHQIEEKAEASPSSVPQQSLFDNYDDCNNIDYGSELANLLGDCACNNEFTPEQIRVIQDLVIKVFPYSTDHIKMCNYLLEKIHKINYYQPQSEKRFAYLCKMIESDIGN